MEKNADLESFFLSYEQHIDLELSIVENKLIGYNRIIIGSDYEFPNVFSFQAPPVYYCTINSVEINNSVIENWTLNPVPLIEDAYKIVNNNVYDAITLQLAHSYISSNYGSKCVDGSAFVENRLIVPIPNEFKLNNNNFVIESDDVKCRLEVKINFEISLLVTKSPIMYTKEGDDSVFISIIPQHYSKSPWFPTLPCYFYLSEKSSPFWNSNWKFKCKVPDKYLAIMPGNLSNTSTVIMNEGFCKDYLKIYEYSYNSGTSFPHLYPNNVTLFIGKYYSEVLYSNKLQIMIYKSSNLEFKSNFQRFCIKVLDEYEKIMGCFLPFKSISILFLDFFINSGNNQYFVDSARISDTLSDIDCISMLSKPVFDSERYFYSHLNETDIGKTMGNIIILPSDIFESNKIELNCLIQLLIQDGTSLELKNNKFITEMNLRIVLTLLDRLASLWFGSFIHIISMQRLPCDGWLLIGMKRYLIRQITRKLFGSDFVSCRIKEALERCVTLIEMGNDHIPLSIKDFHLPFHNNDTQGYPLINWTQRENQCIFRLKSDLVFHSLECYVSDIIKCKTKKFGFGLTDLNSLKDQDSQPKFFNSFFKSFVGKYCVKKNSRYFTTQHFFIHLSSCISQQFINRSKKEIASAQIPQHEQYLLNEIQDKLLAFRSAWIEGVGCPSLTFSTEIQFSSKNSDKILFLADQTPLQPPHFISKEGTSSFIPLITIFKPIIDHLELNNIFEKNVLYLYQYFNGKSPYQANDQIIMQTLIPKFIPSFLWPHDPNNVVVRESNPNLIGLGYIGKLNVPLKHGIGPLFYSNYNFNSQNNSKNENIEKKNILNFTGNEPDYLENQLFPSKSSLRINLKNTHISCNGSYNLWQLGYINVLCSIFLNNYERTLPEKNILEWFCSELISNIPVSVCSGRFWPGYASVFIIQNEGVRTFDLEIIEPQLPNVHEFKIDFGKAKSGGKREIVNSNSSTVPNTSNLQSCSSNSKLNPTTSDVPRLSLLQDLQQKKCFVGRLSVSDIFFSEKIFSSNSLEYLRNKELTDKYGLELHNINSNLLWILTDVSQYWIAKIHRYQTWSMWDQQLLNEINVVGQLEAAEQLGIENYTFEESTKLVVMGRLLYSVDILLNSLYHFDWNISVRKKSLISIIKLFNKISLQKSILIEANYIRILIFSSIKKFIFDIKTLIKHFIQNNGDNSMNFFIQNEKEILFFTIKALSLFWDLNSNSTCDESFCLLAELLERTLNNSSNVFECELFFNILKSFENSKLSNSISMSNTPIKKFVFLINNHILRVLNDEKYFSDSINTRTFGLIFRIVSKHSNIFNFVNDTFRNKSATYFDPLFFVDIPFNIDNLWWKKHASLNGTLRKPLYSLSEDPILQIQALRCYFHLSLQGYCDIFTVYINNKTKNDLKFLQISPKIVHRQMMGTFFESNICSQKGCDNTWNDSNDEYENLSLIGLFNVWKFSEKTNSVESKEFPKNLLDTLSICVLIHTKMFSSIEKALLLGVTNSNKLKILSMLWSSFIDAFDGLIRNKPHLFNQFVMVQAHAEFLPLINNSSSFNTADYLDKLEDVRQCCIFMSQMILNSPISLSSYPFDPYLFENILNIYVSLFGHGVPVCMNLHKSNFNGNAFNDLLFDMDGYFVFETPEVPMKEVVKKRQRLIKRGYNLSDMSQVRRLCDDENYIISRGWKHMCKKITQCLIDSPYGAPFIHPVNENDAPEYYNLIDKPIDLTKIMDNIKQDTYKSIEHFRLDIELVFSNCKKYNEPSSIIVNWCNELKAEFDALYSSVLKYFTEGNSL